MFELINYTKLTSANSRDIQGGKKGPGGPGTFRVSRSCPARTTGPSRSLGPVLSRPVPGPSRDFPGRDSPAGKPTANAKEQYDKADFWL